MQVQLQLQVQLQVQVQVQRTGQERNFVFLIEAHAELVTITFFLKIDALGPSSKDIS